jgi:hypothetical protein
LHVQASLGVAAKQSSALRTTAWQTGIARMASQRRTQVEASRQ